MVGAASAAQGRTRRLSGRWESPAATAGRYSCLGAAVGVVPVPSFSIVACPCPVSSRHGRRSGSGRASPGGPPLKLWRFLAVPFRFRVKGMGRTPTRRGDRLRRAPRRMHRFDDPACPPARQLQPSAPQCAGDVSGNERMSASLRHHLHVTPRIPASLAILANRGAPAARHSHESQDSHGAALPRTVEPIPIDAGGCMQWCAAIRKRSDGAQSDSRCRTAVGRVGLPQIACWSANKRAKHRSDSRARNDQVTGIAGTIRRECFTGSASISGGQQ